MRVAMRRTLLIRGLPSPPCSAAFPNDSSVMQGEQQHLHLSSAGGGDVDLTLRLQDHLAKLSEKLTHADGVIQQQATAFSMLRRQQAVLERRVVAMEEEAARMQQKIAETTRLASDVVLQHRNVEALVQQMEKVVLKHVASPKDGKPAGGDASPSTGGSRGEEQTLPQAMQTTSTYSAVNTELHTTATLPSLSSTASSSVSAAGYAVAGVEAQVSAVSARLEALQARIDQLTLGKLALDKVQLHAQKLTNNHQEQEALVGKAVSCVTEAAGVGGGSGSGMGATERSTEALAALLKSTGAFPFKDATGATRISSQKVLVRGVPVNVGASDIRDLFSHVGVVVSCVVRRMPAAPEATKASPHFSRYRSQRQEEEGDGKAVREAATADGPVTSATATHATAAEVQERTFEVTYHTVEQAVRAVLQLDAYKLHGKHVISVEPMVAADIIAAIQQLEQEFKRR
ncbi:hypothetical protein TraAM80_09393 [Trypanosoma rangeli]|uniref:RNA-binding protein n=1 Tax=Trypanosoma rangeli TaxID=5698 RepID=A0A3R7JY32_TRYRA|nr:uncharacterized protein TraAM80_09393 [Trypanosoma rangeli]RNE97302.1 hypothetical protein TraAM80_09393 [Trypanosoma rangeli]|eukprot:RNE97302.1 hypothetical protein TraAM80_09393 [Trypanosoma rangeli]